MFARFHEAGNLHLPNEKQTCLMFSGICAWKEAQSNFITNWYGEVDENWRTVQDKQIGNND